MFCKFCGNKIAEDSIFCAFCGAKLDYTNTTIDHPSEKIHKQNIFGKYESLFEINQVRIILGIYLGWLLINFIFLVINWGSGDVNSFWPFQRDSLFKEYDFSEFILYSLTPLFIFMLIILFGAKKDSSTKNDTKFDTAYKRDFQPITFGFGLIILHFVLIAVLRSSKNPEQDRAILSVIVLIIRIILTFYIVSIAKKLNRDQFGWGIFFFFIPVFALFFIGFKRRLKKNIKENIIRKDNVNTFLDSAYYNNRMGEKTKAISDLEEGLKVFNDNLSLLKFLGQLYFETGNLIGAKQIFQKLIDDGNYLGFSNLYLGEIAYKNHDLVESIGYWKQASQNGVNDAQNKLDLFNEFKGKYFLTEKEAKRKTRIKFIKPRISIDNMQYLEGILEIDKYKKNYPVDIDLDFNPVSLLMELYVYGGWTKFIAISYLEILKIEYDKDSKISTIHLFDNSMILLEFKYKNSTKTRMKYEKLIELQKEFSSKYKY
jgi:hypothetical protein